MSYKYFVPRDSADLHDWLHLQQYTDKDVLKYYICPMIKFYSVKYPAIIKDYITQYIVELDDFECIGIPDKIIAAYMKHLNKVG